MKHSLARTAVALASASLALGLSATGANATGTSGHEVGSYSTSQSGGHFSGPVHAGKDRDIARLQKALRAAKHERAEARAEASDRRAADTVADIDANAAKSAVLAATEKAYDAKADLATARTRLNEVRNLIANGSLLVEENRTAQDAAAAAVTKAEEAHVAADSEVAARKGDLDTKTAERDAAEADYQAALAEVDRIQTSIDEAQAALTAANARFATAQAALSQANQTLSQRIQSYSGGCWLVGVDEVWCRDNTGVDAPRGEVTEAYRALLAAQTEYMNANNARTAADQAYASSGTGLTSSQEEVARLASVRDAAQSAVDTAQTALDKATPVLAEAAAAAEAARDDLAVLVAEGADLADRLASAQSDEKAAVKVEASKAAALSDADTALDQAKETSEQATGTAARTEQDVRSAQGNLDDARKQVAKVKDRLKKIRQGR